MLDRLHLATKKDFSEKERNQLAKEGKAMPDGSYPITSAADVEHAVRLVGMGSDPESKIKSHIIARAKEIGAEDKLPDSWRGKKAEKPMGALTSRAAHKRAFVLDPNQSDPATTDTMQEDPSVDMIKPPTSYTDIMRSYPKTPLQNPRPLTSEEENKLTNQTRVPLTRF